MKFKSVPCKMISHEKRVLKFDKKGLYETTDKDEIKTIQGAIGVEEVKKGKGED